MKRRKDLILSGFRVRYVVRQWLNAMGLAGRNVTEHIKRLYEKESESLLLMCQKNTSVKMT